jgi:hypothetical protein
MKVLNSKRPAVMKAYALALLILAESSEVFVAV